MANPTIADKVPYVSGDPLTAANTILAAEMNSIKNAFLTKVDTSTGMGLSHNDYNDAAVSKLSDVAKNGYVYSFLTNWKNKLKTNPGAAKLIWVGDSTADFTGNAISIPDYLFFLTLPGEPLAGFDSATNMPNFGVNGATIDNFISTGISAVIAEAPDLIIFSYGINDVRGNNKTKDQLKTAIITAIEALRAGLPNTDFVLRMPNSFEARTTGQGYISAGSYGSTQAAAQAQSIILYNAYKELENYWNNVVLFNSQDEIFGRTALMLSPYMSDEIHPLYGDIVKKIASVIGVQEAVTAERAKLALQKNYTAPWTVYPKVLDYKPNFRQVAKGTLSAQTAGSYIDIDFADANGATEVLHNIFSGDILNIGNNTFFKIPTFATITAAYANRIRVLGAIPSNSEVTGTPIIIYRSVFNHTATTEPYFKDIKNYPYRRRVYVYGRSGSFDIYTPIDDDLTFRTPLLSTSSYIATVTASDVVCVDGYAPLVLTGATFSTINSGVDLRATISGDYSAWQGQPAYIFGNHKYENPF